MALIAPHSAMSHDRKRTETLFLFFKSKTDQAQSSNVVPDTPTPSTNEQETSNAFNVQVSFNIEKRVC
ncbi:hypothetical protein ACET3Z_009597 [Daucus carota]